jgi:hypothetical protein
MIHTDQDVITIVSGLPRSGTSMLMKMLEAGGMPILTDKVRSADIDNPKGYYEFERVKKLAAGDYLWIEGARGKAVKVISALLTYLPPDFQYRVLFIQRPLPQVLASQQQMLIHHGKASDPVSDDEMIRIYEKHLAKVTQWLADQPNFQVLYVSYVQLIDNPDALISQIRNFLGMQLDLAKMRETIDPSLYRQRS